MPTTKEKRHYYNELYKHIQDEIIDYSSICLDKHNKATYMCKCPICKVNRGFLRKSQSLIPCKSCGQKGKFSSLKGKKRDSDFSKKISEANLKIKQRSNPNWTPMSKIEKNIAHSIRSRINKSIKNKTKSSQELTGKSWKDLVLYLESKFYSNPRNNEMMTWENYGRNGWHIDHIRPLSSFNLDDPLQINDACHYTNLQPLWWFENLKKSDFYETW